MTKTPALSELRDVHALVRDHVIETPTVPWRSSLLDERIAPRTDVFLKLELLQVTGTFKPRGALACMLRADPAVLRRGVTAVSAGNHAIAVAYAAQRLGTSAKVVMTESANPFRREAVQRYGAELVIAPDVHAAFERVREIEASEERLFVHPFEGPDIVAGTAGVGLELGDAIPGLDAVVVPIGGGGLCAGIASALAHVSPATRVYGVEPHGANSMQRSFAAERPVAIDAVATIADSLGAPYALPYSFDLCRRHVHKLVQVGDDDLRAAMDLLFHAAKLAVEPAGAAATAALLGPLREELAGARVGLIVCGTNIDRASYAQLLGH